MTEELERLTPRQSEILALVAKGFTNIEIGELLELSAGTVKVHVSAIIERLDVTNRTEAATIWLRSRLSSYLTNKSRTQNTARQTVCVLPFLCTETEGETASFAFWARAQICDLLIKNGVSVVDGHTAAAISQAGLSIKLIRDNLGAAHVVKASLERDVNDYVISIDCLDAQAEKSQLSAVYRIETATADISYLDIAIDILKACKGDDGENPPATALSPDFEKESLVAYWRGRHCFSQRTPQSLLKSCEHFQTSVSLNMAFTDGYVGLANSAHQIGYYGESAQKYFYEMGKGAAHKAVESDPLSAKAHAALAYSQFIADWDFSAARQSFERARHLDPAYDESLMWYSLLAIILSEEELALSLAEEGLSRNPMAIPHFTHIGHVYRSQNRFDEAIAHLNIAVEMEPNYIRANIWLALTHADLGELDVARQYAQRMMNAYGRVSTLLGIRGYIAGLNGDSKDCRRIIDEIRLLPGADSFAALYVAFCLIGLGELDEAMQWIWKAKEQRPPLLLGWRSDPIYARLRDHAEFDAVASAIGLPPRR